MTRIAAALLLAASTASAAPRAVVDGSWWSSGEVRPLTPTAWLTETGAPPQFRLSGERELPLLRRYVDPSVERANAWQRFWHGRFGPAQSVDRTELSWSSSACEATEPSESDGFAIRFAGERLMAPSLPLLPVLGAEVLPTWALGVTPAPNSGALDLSPAARCKPWQRPYTVTVARYGAEVDTFTLLDCDGSVAIDAMDHLSVLARPPGTPRPELPLPLEPMASVHGEWLPAVRLLDPRLAWVLASISESFPHRVIYVISGYRRQAHDGFHHKARALDMFVMGVKNEDLFRVCRKLRDVGCGYYPNNKFVHVDVRPPGTGHAMWVDDSAPGQPSHYVDAWPGVVSGGALVWAGGEG
ncbi:MAG: DUF882 domain-containing protein [Myxococcales bacterium]|nr:DUF882 domain-containing protein [Myxococcales bacterium]